MGVRDAILAARPNEEVVELEQGRVLVRGMTVAARDAVQRAVVEGGWFRQAVLRHCCFDAETGEPLFGPTDDVLAIPANITEPLIDAATRLTALTQAEVDELEGNSERTSSDNTASA